MFGQGVDVNLRTVMPVKTWVPAPRLSGVSPLSIRIL